MEGTIRVRELQGGGLGAAVFVTEMLYMWERGGRQEAPPTDFSFEMRMPTYASGSSGGGGGLARRRLLPPSYDSRLTSIPGFGTTVQYEFVVSVRRIRATPLDLLKKNVW